MTRPLLTIAQVVDQFDLSRATVRRGIDSGKFSGAEKDAQGRWLVPIAALIAADIKPRKTWLNGVAAEHAHERAQGAHLVNEPNKIKVATERAHENNEHAHNASRIAQLEAELNAEKRLREAAERNAEDLRIAMRMIESRPSEPLMQNAEIRTRKRWWSRNPGK